MGVSQPALSFAQKPAQRHGSGVVEGTGLAPHIMALQDVGDLSAPRGTTRWARALRGKLIDALQNTDSTVRLIRDFVKALADTHAYQQLEQPDGTPFPSMTAFVQTRQPFGLDCNPDVLLTLVVETRETMLEMPPREYARAIAEEIAKARKKPLGEHGKVMIDPGQPRGVNGQFQSKEPKDYNIISRNGNSSAYLLRRLARDRPDLLEALERGEYPSVYAVAKTAGIIKSRLQIPLSEDPKALAKTLRQKCDATFLQALIVALQEED